MTDPGGDGDISAEPPLGGALLPGSDHVLPPHLPSLHLPRAYPLPDEPDASPEVVLLFKAPVHQP